MTRPAADRRVILVLAHLADQLEHDGHGLSHVPRELAAWLNDPAGDDGCRSCGAPVERVPVGRPRVHCEGCRAPRRTAGPRVKSDPVERFWAKVEKTTECWIWTGTRVHDGYGQFWQGSHKVMAHRFAYECIVGPIPEGLTLDHLCRNRACVNPAHLEPVTIAENVRRGYAHRTACDKLRQSAG